ncbi:DF family (seleno)protein [Actinotalea fermentans]|uniref:Alkylmercury lyase n=1 Tax=Actinotalea fermentans TaxID=43671 RepID=A0A511YYM2_9CELL|nr:thioredoxin family protein [Actinotalea fermentans]KGM17812.1 alkylmercury lyase [Actinotalea fermentans ATCC 43279 = JCM 9966 = DSM 3133]GEN80301.1 hypothetical protein AFE02nite_20350 [Actinotalea fermentans]
MRAQLLYFDGCPNWHVADARLREALRMVGSDAKVERVLITTQEQAEHWAFHGSPSLLLDGQDPFAQPGAPVGLSCRLYRTANGVAGSPTMEELVAAIQSASSPQLAENGPQPTRAIRRSRRRSAPLSPL